jgi:protein-disulfide isomerase
LPLLLAVAGALVAACGGDDDDNTPGTQASQPGATNTLPAGDATPTIDETALLALDAAHAAFPSDLVDGYAVGAADAPLTLTMYEDFQCPFCLRFTTVFEPMLVEEYVKAGQLRLEFQHFPILGPESEAAAAAAECAAQQNRFWALHHELFRLQAASGQLTGEQLNIGRFADDELRALAEAAGLDLATYDACYADPATEATVDDMAARARMHGLSGTPGFLINRTALGGGAPGSLDAWRQFIDEWLAEVAGGS